MMTNDDTAPVVDLTAEECWELLALARFGRLAYLLVDEVHVVPINVVADAGSLLFRTASGNKLLAAAMHAPVAFEIDWHDERVAWSVVARGRLRRLPEDEASRVEPKLVEPWVSSPKYDVVEIIPESVSGRRFVLSRPDAGTS